MKNQKKAVSKPNLDALKDLIVNNPRARERISFREIEKEIKESEKRQGDKVMSLWEV